MTKSIMLSLAVTAIILTGCKKIDDASTEGTEWQIGDSELKELGRNDAQKAYDKANAKMHAGMAAVNPDPDIAFMQGMVPHHQGAVDMAEIVLKYGKDPETRALAKTIIESQTREIDQMNAWLEERGVEPAKPSEVDHEAMGH